MLLMPQPDTSRASRMAPTGRQRRDTDAAVASERGMGVLRRTTGTGAYVASRADKFSGRRDADRGFRLGGDDAGPREAGDFGRPKRQSRARRFGASHAAIRPPRRPWP